MRYLPIVVLALHVLIMPAAAQKKALTFTDIMQFRAIEHARISDDGAWVAFTAQPDRGDGEVIVRSTQGTTRYAVPLGSHPVFSKDGQWVALKLNPSLEAQEKAAKDDKPSAGMALLNTSTGDINTITRVKAFSFSNDGNWIAIHHEKPDDESGETENEATEADASEKEKKRKPGTDLEIRHLASGDQLVLSGVRTFAFDEANNYVAYAVATSDGEADGLFALKLDASLFENKPITIDTRNRSHYTQLAWNESTNMLGFLAATEDEEGEPGHAKLMTWDGNETSEATSPSALPERWHIPAENSLKWTKDGERLFFGLRPTEADDTNEKADTTFAPYDETALLADREVDVWHWNDPLINPHQKKQWNQEQKRTYAAVYHTGSGKVVPLADEVIDETIIPENARRMLARTRRPYSKERTWDGSYVDLYVIDLKTGDKSRIAERVQYTNALSPTGRYAVYYQDRHWHLVDLQNGSEQNLTGDLPQPFANEDDDYPQDDPGYGVGGWIEDDQAVLLYDKYDIWSFPTDGSDPINLTKGEGRASKRIFRIIKTDDDQQFFAENERLLLSAYHDLKKNYGFYELPMGKSGPRALLEEKKRFRFITKAKDADLLLYTREDYNEFPDLWVSDPAFKTPRKATDVNPQMTDFAWGTSELISWTSTDGIPLQGVVIKPDNFDPSKKYPVIVYFYRFFSQRLHEFNQPRVNHRPAFPLYASHDYVIFLPDVRFEIGRPGFSATKAIVPGVQKLVDMGIADPDALGLHGHSWSGYQTAFMVTQTDIFAAAIAGAPVSNMTSAYSGIRWQTGLARQFQYEKSQSRLGGTLWDARDRYIDNSPVFFADRIDTPLLIMHGDDDGAVPWYQSIELYLALRRLEKDAIFLQYRGEPHHLQKYPNKLDYAIKMKEYFDHYLKGAPAAEWITKGVPYQGK